MFLDFAACRGLDPEQFKLLAAFAHHADPAGACRVLQAELAAEMGISASTVCRWTAELVHRGCLTRMRIAGGTYHYRIAAGFLAGLFPAETINSYPRYKFVPEVQINCSTVEQSNCPTMGQSKTRPKTAGNPKGAEAEPPELHTVKLHTPKSGIAHAASADSGAPADTPARLELSSGSKEPSERELSLSQDKIPDGWEAAAAAERRLAGLGPVNLRAEWRKLVAHAEGSAINLWRWRKWALRAWCDTRIPPRASDLLPANLLHGEANLPGDDRQQRQARDWVRRGFWLRDGSWGPAPDQPGCSLPAGLVAWCLRERAAAAA